MADDRLQQVVLSSEEWGEIEGCSMALHSALRCEGADENEKLELVQSVKIRFERTVSKVSERLSDES